MLSLNLGSTRAVTQLPASSFPERAEAYVCDQCGCDVTKHFCRSRAHVWSPMGPERFKCTCGKSYLTGATEWDHLRHWGRRKRIGETIGIGIILSVISSIFAFLIYLFLHFIFGVGRGALITATIITWLPFALLQIMFWPGVLASKFRTGLRAND